MAFRAQTSFEYLLVVVGSILVILVVVLAVQGVINSTQISVNSTLPVVNATEANYTRTPTPLPDFPCASACVATLDCQRACGADSGYYCGPSNVCIRS